MYTKKRGVGKRGRDEVTEDIRYDRTETGRKCES